MPMRCGLVKKWSKEAPYMRETRYRFTVEWNVLKRYRTWQASRKEFLYPENSIEPELRDDKEPQFEPEQESTARLEKRDDDS
jgi:hypothetical protein